ncbi:MAG TPA: sensor histidine kinase, partial [Alphaproteobacteria bacterium]|nr:sensor histidine kinase [Alphaproteobacteria bacterium]
MTYSLSARVLVLTLFFVMVSEVLIYVPSIASFRMNYLKERVQSAQLASLALEATPDRIVSTELERNLLDQAE